MLNDAARSRIKVKVKDGEDGEKVKRLRDISLWN